VTFNRYLVTGGLGYIGSVVVEELVRGGAQVVVVDNGLSGAAPHVATFFEFRVPEYCRFQFNGKIHIA